MTMMISISSCCWNIAAGAGPIIIIILSCCFVSSGVQAEAEGEAAGSPGVASPPLPAVAPLAFGGSSIGVMVGLVSAAIFFSLTFLVILYVVKHCTTGTGGDNHHHNTTTTGIGIGGGASSSSWYYNYINNNHASSSSSSAANYRRGGDDGGRKKSGIERRVIESLPVLRFHSLLNNQKKKKDDVEINCGVCLSRFEAADVLRLLPKCNHAFHVECLDTWLDSHSTCPLCRFRVHPEDIFILPPPPPDHQDHPPLAYRRISGRHSSAGDHIHQQQQQQQQQGRRIITRTSSTVQEWATSFIRRSLDGVGVGVGVGGFKFKKMMMIKTQYSDDGSSGHDASASASAGMVRKDGLLLLTNDEMSAPEEEMDHRHRRIIISSHLTTPLSSDPRQRWSDVHPSSDLLYLRSQMILMMTDAALKQQQQQQGVVTSKTRDRLQTSVSEITGLSSFPQAPHDFADQPTNALH